MSTRIEQQLFEILIVDDDPHARELLKLALDDPRFNLTLCEGGEQGLTFCQNKLPDLAILDVQMPGINGLELCSWIKLNCKQNFVPVLMLTSLAELDDKVTGLNCGADDYVTKPFSLLELFARVNALLRIKTLTNELNYTRNLLAQKEKELITTQVAGAAAHELGQPLTSLLLNCQLLTRLTTNNPNLNEIIIEINKQSDRIKLIINKLSQVQRYELKEYTENLQILELDLEDHKNPI